MSAKVADSNLDNLSGDLMQKKKVDLHLNAYLSKGFGHENHSVTGHVEDNTSCEVGEEVVEGNPAEIGEEALPEEEVGLVEKLSGTSEACGIDADEKNPEEKGSEKLQG